MEIEVLRRDEALTICIAVGRAKAHRETIAISLDKMHPLKLMHLLRADMIATTKIHTVGNLYDKFIRPRSLVYVFFLKQNISVLFECLKN